jgi:hypothetical protein
MLMYQISESGAGGGEESKGCRTLRRDLAIVATAQSRCSESNVSALASVARALVASVGEARPAQTYSQFGAITSQARAHGETSTCPAACPGALLYFAGAVQAPTV